MINLQIIRLLLKTPFRIFLLLIFFTGLGSANAQENYDILTLKIDSLANAGLPKSALQLADQLDASARTSNNAPQQIKAVIYRITFQSYLEENALEAIITRLRADINKADYPVKPVLQSLLAQMYWNYYQQNRYQFSQRSKLEKTNADFTSWDLQTIISETSRLFELSLKDVKREQETPISVLDGVLDGDKSTRYLRPTLYDLLVQRALSFYLSGEAVINKPRLPFSVNDPLYFGDSHALVRLTINTNDTASAYYKGIKYLQQATAYHLDAGQDEAVAAVDLQRLKFLSGVSTVEHKNSLYILALKQIAAAYKSKPISSDALVLLGQYYQRLDSLKTAYAFFKTAMAAFPESTGGSNARALIGQIKAMELSASIENINMPYKPILALLNYKNLSTAQYLLYRLSEKQMKEFTNGIDQAYRFNDQPKARFDYLKPFKAIQGKPIKWTNPGDYRKHSFEFKIDSLPPGNYVMVLKNPSAKSDSLTAITNFKVTGLMYNIRENPDGNIEARVVDRETGKPLNGVKINFTSSYDEYNNTTKKSERKYTVENGTSDRDGQFLSKQFTGRNSVDVVLKTKGDTLSNSDEFIYGAQDDTDDEPKDKTVFFTDRQIYRPGQTIYFKGMQLLLFKDKNKLVADKKVEVAFLDVNGKKVSSLKLTTNDFGSFTGSLIIPQTMLNGEVQLSTDDGDISLKVEEYKRPTFQVSFLPVKESYKINDSVTVKGAVWAFSGYGLSQARVAYHITRRASSSGRFNDTQYNRYNSNYQTEEVASDTITTDDQGNFKVKFKATRSDLNGNVNINYAYTINADVTDGSGETRSSETSVTIGDHDILINSYLPEILFAKDTIKAPISVTNLNGQLQKGEVKVEVYALKDAGKIFKNRLWSKPGQFELSKEDFEMQFPDYPYKNEDELPYREKLNKAISLTIKVDTLKPGIIDLQKLRTEPSGTYAVVISARNEKGDTTSLTRYVNLVNGEAQPSKFENWVIPVINILKKGQSAEFSVGIGEKINVLMERYNGTKLISSKWITVDQGQQIFKIPVNDTEKYPAVQFLMTYHNRVYTSYQKIYRLSEDRNLDIKFLTYHNKLQPGEKEQWKLRITGQDNKRGAEILAAMYDASLDDITPAENWQNLLDPQSYGQPNYFYWVNYRPVQRANTISIFNDSNYFQLLTHDYETLNLFGYDYYGGYNNGYQRYLKKIKENLSAAENDKRLKDEYAKKAALIKNGYDISGVIKGADDKQSLPGVMIRVKGSAIGTQSNSHGYFKLKVPFNAVLIFSYIGYQTQEISTLRNEVLNVNLKPSASALNEVVVVGYGVKKKMDVTGAVSSVRIRGLASPVPLAESEVLAGRAAGVNVSQYAPGSSDTVILREIRASNQRLKPITIRSNFNETAFFYPQLHTNENGEILIDFIIPEALTKWKFRALAHTQDLKTGYIESTIVTQKQLSINANMPRFMREGDTVTISTRLANLTGSKLKGNVKMFFFNALNMQPVSLFLNPADAGQAFEIPGNTTKTVSFELHIPAGLDALTYRLTADGGKYTDGEENTLLVLPNRMLVTESMPMMVRAGQTKRFNFDKLVNQNSTTLKNKTLTLEYTQNPVWYAVQSLPYLMEFPYECSEQIFSRYFANSLATGFVNRMPVVKRVFDRWKSTNSTELLSNLEKNQELKSTLLEETPWLKDAENETEQKKRIALLFDMNKMSDELKLNLDKLQKKQLSDGGFPWFGGDRSDRYITQHIVESIGELRHVGLANQPSLDQIANSAIKYMDTQLLDDHRYAAKNKIKDDYSDLEIEAWFARSYFPDEKLSSEMKTIRDGYLNWAATGWKQQNVYEQGMIALTMQRYKKPLIAQQIERSLVETAQHSDEMGMYWAKNQLGYHWYESPVETQSLLIELFTEIGSNAAAVEEMKIWLLRNKQTNDWKTTKATAAACYSLLLKGSSSLSDTGRSVIKLNDTPIETLKPDAKAGAGTGYIKTSWADEQVKPAYGKIEIKNNGKTVSWGAMHWQYLENIDKVTSAQTNIHLERKYYIQKQTDAGIVLTAVDAIHQPKTGDLLKVVVNLKADRDFEYVQLKDMRPAGTEPVDQLSEFKYQDGLYYYQVTKDVATNFFISELNKGNYVFEYRLRVAQPGSFSTGITTVQCMYAPEFNAHSNGERMNIKIIQQSLSKLNGERGNLRSIFQALFKL